MNEDFIASPLVCNFLCFCFSGMQNIYFSITVLWFKYQNLIHYLGPGKNSTHERPEREDNQAQGQHGTVEETHHLGAAKVNSQHTVSIIQRIK